MLCIFGDHQFHGHDENKAVPHTSTEAQVISLVTCLRMEGLHAVVLWDTVIAVLEPLANRARGRVNSNLQTSRATQETIDSCSTRRSIVQ